MAIYQRLIVMRKKLKLSQTELAKALNCSQPNISDYEKGKIALPISALSIISRTYNINMEWLVNGEGEMFKQNNTVNGPVNSNTNNTSNPDIQQELISCQKELIQLRQQNSLLKEENKDLNTKIKEKLEKIIDLQDRLIKT